MKYARVEAFQLKRQLHLAAYRLHCIKSESFWQIRHW